MATRKAYEYVLFFDPELKSFYSYCEQSGILVQETAPQRFMEQALTDRKILSHIMDIDVYSKGKKHTEPFMRRPIPTAFLTPRKYRFPIYSTEEPIYEAQLEQIKFNEEGMLLKNQYKESIKIRVFLGSIRKQVEPVKKSYPHLNTEFIEEIEVKLITSVNEVIRTVCRTILQEFKVVITTESSHNRLILKVKGREEYMYGNEQLSSYLSVLHCISENIILNVEIVEEDINKGRQQFHKFIFLRYEQDIGKGKFEGFPWEQLMLQEHCGFLLWYCPDVYHLSLKYLRPIDSNEGDLEEVKVKIGNKVEDKIRRNKMRFPRFLLKENIQVFLEKRREEIEKKIISLEGDTIYSGQCNFAYSLQILSVNNACSLLKAFKPEASTEKRHILKFTSSKDMKEPGLATLVTSQKRYEIGVEARKNNFCLFPYQFNIAAELYYNGEPISVNNPEQRDTEREDTEPLLFEDNPKINQTIHFMPLSQIMMETSLVLKMRIFSKEGEGVVCGVGVIKLFDEFGYLRQGVHDVQLYGTEKIDPIKLGCYSHFIHSIDRITHISVKFPSFRNPVRWTLMDPKSQAMLGLVFHQHAPPNIEIEKKMTELTKLLKYDPLKMFEYTLDEKNILRLGKKYYKHQSDKLINYLYSIDWKNSIQVAEAYQSLKDWAPLKPIQALFLLTPQLSDEKVRYFAVKCLDQTKNSQFCLYSNQITQALVSFETDENPLIDLIIERCCQDPYIVAQEFFWQFWNRASQSITHNRFKLYLQLLLLTSPIRFSFYQQVKLNDKLILSNNNLCTKSEGMSYVEKNEKFKKELKEIEKDLLSIDKSGFSFPIRPEMKFVKILEEASKMYDSAKVPFALACKSGREGAKTVKPKEEEKEESDYKVMFKCGDDIKQDHLILQIFKIFNKLWMEAGMNLKMSIYRVLSTGTEVGFIEIVENSENSHYIHKKHSKEMIEAFDDKAIYNYLTHYNQSDSMKIAKQNFLRSSAAYLVATYVLGIGDRHSGNYMVQKDGRFFHIDFGHILGNFKKKLRIKRERTPFVFTTEFSYVIGDEKSNDFNRFEVYCSTAYNILRRNASMIVNLMMMMVGAEIPELQKYEHCHYMIEKLNLDMSDLQASEHLQKEIQLTLQSDFKKYDNWIHEIVRK